MLQTFSRSITGAFVCGILFAAFVIILQPASDAALVKWDVKATVYQIVDPDAIFGDVRVGDRVRGTMSYDLSTVPVSMNAEYADYVHPPTFPVASMIVEDPRTGDELIFAGDIREFPFAWLDIYNDLDAGNFGLVDIVAVTKSVMPPPGYNRTLAAVGVELDGPPSTISDTNMPAELHLDDWQIARIWFGDPLDSNFEFTSIAAEINSLTPAIVPSVFGDFDDDGDADGADFLWWQRALGSNSPAVDADSNGIIDGADLNLWRGSFSTALGSPVAATLPEPMTLGLLVIAAAATTMIRRARHRDPRPIRCRPAKLDGCEQSAGRPVLPAPGPCTAINKRSRTSWADATAAAGLSPVAR